MVTLFMGIIVAASRSYNGGDVIVLAVCAQPQPQILSGYVSLPLVNSVRI